MHAGADTRVPSIAASAGPHIFANRSSVARSENHMFDPAPTGVAPGSGSSPGPGRATPPAVPPPHP